MAMYRNDPSRQWDDLGARRGVPSTISRTPTQKTMSQRPGQGRQFPGNLASELSGPNLNEAPSVATYQTGRQTAQTKFSKTSRGPARFGSYVPRMSFKPGMLMRATHHVPALPSSTIKTGAFTKSKLGEVCSKMRPFIVIACNEETYQALPLYTFGETGTSSVMCKDEYVSVQDHRCTGSFENQSVYEPLRTGLLDPGVDLFNKASVCHLAGPFTFTYSTHVHFEGYLDAGSTRRLAHLRHKFDVQMLEQALKVRDDDYIKNAPHGAMGTILK